ncbi:glucose-6-phosphate isomerase [Candidatus Gracilibacteria bacterium]|nr:glucose-6-phosphate isomerase [Thermales bacterium]NJL97205.1 glucose-6-phosphate isomerase [Candidatus Gracilibacteria bacterium]NJS41475.1 glucose-6-phosphate isomerase [Candidatus Gracilibacteria bacterium]
MIHLKLDNLRRVNCSSFIDDIEQNFENYRQAIINKGQGWLSLPFDHENRDIAEDFAQSNGDQYDNIVLLGIGGSSLGPKCLRDCLYNYKKNKTKRFVILDNIDPDYLTSWSREFNLRKTLFLVVSKSGRTPETISQYLFFRQKILENDLIVKDHFVFITDPIEGYLRTVSQKEGIVAFDIPSNVGGRFSVLSNVGLVIAEFMGIDTKALLCGGQAGIEAFKNSPNGKGCYAYQLALNQYNLAESGHNINIIIPYSSRLKIFGDWYTQLLSESIGKKLDRNGNIVHTGITPHAALGVTDQHSQLQLFKDGPCDKLIIFIEVMNFESSINIPAVDDELSLYLSGVGFDDLLKAELAGTKLSLTESGKPNLSVVVDKVDAYNLGELFVLFELATAFLGELYNINAFDQPGVERSKTLTKEILEG